jgi:hypothetical protein
MLLESPCNHNNYSNFGFITAHVHLLLVGFMLMIVMGVATWMFPRPV